MQNSSLHRASKIPKDATFWPLHCTQELTADRRYFGSTINGDCSALTYPAYGRLNVVKTVVRPCRADTEKLLACYQQQLSDGRIRPWTGMPSGKMRTDEGHDKAMVRCLMELLGSVIYSPDNLELDEASLSMWEEQVDSPSYPTLTTQYKLHQMTAFVTGLPALPTFTTEDKKRGEVHFWEWQSTNVKGEGGGGHHRQARRAHRGTHADAGLLLLHTVLGQPRGPTCRMGAAAEDVRATQAHI